MARIVLTTWGSHGDVDPFLGLALGLKARGHRVALATMAYFRELVAGAGIDFFPIRPNIDPARLDIVERIMHPTDGSRFLLTELLFPEIEDAFNDVSAAADGADLLVSHPVTFATPLVAQHRRMPWASAVLSPMSFFSAYDPPVVPQLPWLKALPSRGRWPGQIVVGLARSATHSWSEPVYALRRKLGLPENGQPLFKGQHSPSLVLAMFSRVLSEPQPDWPPNVVVTGHAFHDAPHGTSLPSGVEAFLRAGPPPIVFTLGSSAVLVPGPFWRESIEATRRLGARALLLAGPDGTSALADAIGPDILAIDRAPHSLLFPRASVVVQQCGIGTIAQSLRSGRPMLAVPYAHDQPDNAWRARKLGLARILPPKQYRAANVARELGTLREDGRYAQAAARVATVVRSESGVTAACDAIERTFALKP